MSDIVRTAEIVASQEAARLDLKELGDKFSLWTYDDEGNVAPSLLIYRFDSGSITLDLPLGPVNLSAAIARDIARELVDLANQIDGRGTR